MTSATAVVATSVLTGAVAATVAAVVVPPTRRLGPRVRPYTVAARVALGRVPDVGAVAAPRGSTLVRLFGPLLGAAAARVARLTEPDADERLRLRLRQAGLLSEVPDELRVTEYRARQLASGVGGAAAVFLVLTALGAASAAVVLATVLACAAGVMRWRGRVERAVAERSDRMRIELYTVNQLLAMNVRVGGGVIAATRRVVERGRGAVVDELREALVAHESGARAAEAFRRIAATTPEPHAARTYRLLAAGAEWGTDLAEGLLALSDDIRDVRREALRRQATRRRGAMLVPIVAVLAPVMLLFVAAPLPWLVLGGRG